MKERDDLLGRGIDSCQVWTFVNITAVAGQRQIVRIIGAAVLFRHDVLYMMDQLAVFLVRPAIFATPASPHPNEVSRGCIHLLSNCRVQIQAGFELEDRNEIRRIDQRLIFGAIALVKRSLVGPFSEIIDSLLNLWGHLEPGYPPCGFGVETAAKRLQKAVQAYRNAHVPTLTRKPCEPVGEWPWEQRS